MIQLFVLELLRHAAASSPTGTHTRTIALSAIALHRTRQLEFRWAIDAGLGPLLFRALRDDLDQLPTALADLLYGADLTAQVLHGSRLDAAADVVGTCNELGVPVTLLKGISISDQFYPSGHLRPMTDIDVLVSADASKSVEAALVRRGYQYGQLEVGADASHGVPLFRPDCGVFVEVHTALFDEGTTLRRNGIFSPDHVTAASVRSSFDGRPVLRLSNELQLAYIATYWVRDMCAQRIHPSFVAPLLDLVYVLKNSGPTLNWEQLLAELENDYAVASLYLVLAYLQKRHVFDVPASVLAQLARDQSLVGAGELRLLHFLLDRYLIAGRPFKLFNSWHIWLNMLSPGSHVGKWLRLPWRVAFPPGYPGRFDPRIQAQRIGHFFRRLR